MTKTKKCSPNGVPDWLLKLKPGTYVISQIAEITGASATNIFMRFQALGVDHHKHPNDERVNIYEWPGAEFYLTKHHEGRLNEIRERQKA